MRTYATIALLTLALAACRNGPDMETRTFQLQHLRGEEAVELIRPYLFTDREGTPGSFSVAPNRNILSVRETPDNLARIARLLAEHDKPTPNIRLTFQVIQANGAAPVDSAIADIEGELRRLFRFRGYRLAAQGSSTAMQHSPVQMQLDGAGGPYSLMGEVGNVTPGDSGTVELRVGLNSQRGPILNTTVRIGMGHTMVLGGQQGGNSATILAVRAEAAR